MSQTPSEQPEPTAADQPPPPPQVARDAPAKVRFRDRVVGIRRVIAAVAVALAIGILGGIGASNALADDEPTSSRMGTPPDGERPADGEMPAGEMPDGAAPDDAASDDTATE